jgi:thiol-disulfide isomerase/thioredoxin
MSTKALTGILLAGTAGVIIFLFVRLSSDPGKTIELGASKAGACNKGAGDCLPDVNYIDTTGKAYTPQSLQGKVVVVNFWATYCAPCKKEIPDFSKAYDKYKTKGYDELVGMLRTGPPWMHRTGPLATANFQSDSST